MTLGNGGSQFSDSYTPVAPLTHAVELGSFFSPVLPASPTSWPRASLTSGHLCVVIMYKGPGWPRGGGVRSVFCPLVLLPQCSCTLFKGTCTGTGNVPHFLTHHRPALLPIHPPFSVFSCLPCFASPGPSPFTLFPSNPPAPIWKRGLFLSSRGWNPMFTFSSVSAPTPCGALRNQKRTCYYTWACLLPCYLMKGVRIRTREGGSK